ncbi:MAG: hypothetical protein AB8H79_23655 [Myxococcota bacterium]
MAYRSARPLSEVGARAPRSERPKRQRRTPDAERHWTPVPGPSWGPMAPLTPRLRMQAAAGFRAAALPLGPGLFLVAEVPEEQANAEFGLVPMLGPLMWMAARRALEAGSQRAQPQPQAWQAPWPPPQAAPTPQALPPAPDPTSNAGLTPWMQAATALVRPQPAPAAILGWAHPHDLAQLGCGTCWRHQ